MFKFISDCWNNICEKPFSSIIKVTGVVGSGVLAVAFAPAIAAGIGATGILGAASTGTAISSLSGSALANASLAALGGGAVSAGGGGIMAGMAAIGKLGSKAGAIAADAVVNAL